MKKSIDQKEQVARMTLDHAVTEQALGNAETQDLVQYTEDRDLMNQLIGQVQMSRSIAKFVDVVSLSKALEIKKSKLYLTLKGQSALDVDGKKIADVGTWDGFCRLIGTTRSKMDEDLKNLEVFGEDALNSLNRIGAGYRELRKLRKIPEGERDLIINGEAIRAGDKDALVDLIEEIVAKHTKEKAKVEKENTDLKADLEASRKVAEGKNKKINDLEIQLNRSESLKPGEREVELSGKLDDAVRNVLTAFLEPNSVFTQIFEWEDSPRDLRYACAQAMARIKVRMDELHTTFGIEYLELDFDDSWMADNKSNGASVSEYECE